MITKKHLKELADIVHKAQAQAPELAEEVKSFAKRHAPNFSESHWESYMIKKDEEILKKAGWLRSK
jgi:hypothetical protein|tara:strand:- start:296 stop:493 length:198 start_codon:yes stop_codon:yes gene_type:complete